ncbi:hypothetical protein [Tolypothrix sp. VBCCA 56010]|uniref:hypothetical protein n=1 Tax=Tolypothrix sp. VBCCA 56010 TaxID=3137731 RepID=UPI003D7EA8C7
MVANESDIIRQEIIDKASKVFAVFFDGEGYRDIPNLGQAIKNILGLPVYDNIQTEISRERYKERIKSLMRERRLNEFIESLLKRNAYAVLDDEQKRDIKAQQIEISKLLAQLEGQVDQSSSHFSVEQVLGVVITTLGGVLVSIGLAKKKKKSKEQQ